MIVLGERYQVDESFRWDVDREEPGISYRLGTIQWHYGFDRYSFWPADRIFAIDQLEGIIDLMRQLPEPTVQERALYNSYGGDPLAR